MIKLLRFNDLKSHGIVSNWVQLRRMITLYGFPPGIKLGPNSTAWEQSSVENWIASRPTTTKPAPRRKERLAAVSQ